VIFLGVILDFSIISYDISSLLSSLLLMFLWGRHCKYLFLQQVEHSLALHRILDFISDQLKRLIVQICSKELMI
jgi:acyl carrier protein phosphodiesterase